MLGKPVGVVGAAILLALRSACASAVVTAYACNDCSEAQYLNAATNAAEQYNLGGPLSPNVYIYDLTHGAFRKYAISREPVQGGYEYILDDVVPTASESSLWTQAHAAIESNGGRSTFFGNVDASTDTHLPDRNESVYDIVQTSAYQNDISDWLLTGQNAPPLAVDLGLTTVSLIALALEIVLKNDLFSFSMTITTIDHGHIEFHWEAGYTHASLVSATDVNNNTIPLGTNQLPGQYRLRTGSGEPFFDYLNSRFGNQVFIQGANVCTNGLFACSNSAAGYSCEWVHCGGVP